MIELPDSAAFAAKLSEPGFAAAVYAPCAPDLTCRRTTCVIVMLAALASVPVFDHVLR
jgi:hypothetical protein